MTHIASPQPGGYFEGAAFHWPIRVYYADTDAGGVVYHAAYFDMAERSRTELLRALGQPLIGADGEQFVVRRAEIDWFQPARLDDLMVCRTIAKDVGAARVTLEQSFWADSITVAEVLVTLAHVDANLRPRRMPRPLREAFKSCYQR